MSKITEAQTAQLNAFIDNECDRKTRPLMRGAVIVGQLFGLEEMNKFLKQLDDSFKARSR